MSSREIGVALLGLGRAGSIHLESLRSAPGAGLRMVYDVDSSRASQVAKEAGCRAAREPEEVFASDDVRGVVVATPTETHHAFVLAALEAEKAVLCEKPLGLDLDEIDRGFRLAEQKNRPLLVAFQRRFDPSFAAVIEAARAGDLGRLHFIRSVSRDNPLPPIEYIRTSRGIFHDCIVHDLDLIGRVAGEKPIEVFSFASSFIPEVEAIGDVDNVLVSLRFASGLLASIDVSRHSVYGYDQRLEVFGSDGMIQAENRPQTPVVRSTAAGVAWPPLDHSFPTRYREAYRLELECFLDCIRGGSQVPITHDEVRMAHLLADAAERSFREHAPVRPVANPKCESKL